MNELMKKFADGLVGKSETELKEMGVDFRVVSRDGARYRVTCDYRIDRLNVDIVDGVVTKCWVG